jgi:hypothetical protein
MDNTSRPLESTVSDEALFIEELGNSGLSQTVCEKVKNVPHHSNLFLRAWNQYNSICLEALIVAMQ